MAGTGDTFWDSEQLVGFVEKSATERIAVRRVSKGTRQYVDVRVEWRRADERDFLPSKKGVVIAWDAVEDVIALMQEALETAGRKEKKRS